MPSKKSKMTEQESEQLAQRARAMMLDAVGVNTMPLVPMTRITESIAAERERCARIAESYGGSKFEYHCVGQEIARAIRKGDQP